jgi:hypothetical protein
MTTIWTPQIAAIGRRNAELLIHIKIHKIGKRTLNSFVEEDVELKSNLMAFLARLL